MSKVSERKKTGTFMGKDVYMCLANEGTSGPKHLKHRIPSS